MNIKQLIQCLNQYNYDVTVVDTLHEPHSYRGYYEELALERSGKDGTVGELISLLESCLGRTFTGYKGGNFTMTKDSIVNIAYYGRTGGEITDVVSVDGEVILEAPYTVWG